MRVLQLGPFPPPQGGVQTNLTAIRDHLRASGHAAPVINITRHRRPAADDVYYPESAAQTALLLWRIPADIVHLHFGGNLTPRLLALCGFCSCLPGRKTVLTFHSGGYPSSPAGRAAGRHGFAAWSLRRVDGLIAVNQEVAGFFRRCGVAPERIRVISPYVPSPPAAPELPEPLRSFWTAHEPVLLSVGLLEPEYELPLQIAALGAVRATHPRAGLVLIGSGSLESALRERIAAQPWRDHVLLAGDVPHPVTLRAIRESSALLRTTRYDGDALSVREALDLGTPVIASQTAFRPAGCHLVEPLSSGPLNAVVREVLAAKRLIAAPRQPDSKNLDAVLDFYRALLKPAP